MIRQHPQKHGFTLFFAILVSSMLLSIALMMLNFALKEQELSIIGRESQFAFFAADTGAECALYWDNIIINNKKGIFATSTGSGSPPATVNCGGQDSAVTTSVFSGTRATYTFTVVPSQGSLRCATVTVDKNDSNNDGFSFTTIDSRGVNNCVTPPKHRIERAIRVKY